MISTLTLVLSSFLLAAQSPCEALSSLELPNATITTAESVPAGPFTGAGRGRGGAPAELPAHCRVTAVLTPSADSEIRMEAWLPAQGWNGKFLAAGNGGWAGSIQGYPEMQAALRAGYATAANDTGHEGFNGTFAFDHPDKLVDFAYRAMHEMVVDSKTLIDAFYGRGPRLSYYQGCSTGGRQGVMSASRYPADFDAIIAGAPANPQTHLHAGDLWRAAEVFTQPQRLLSREQLSLLHSSVIQACDALDGVEDGLLTDPSMCRFDPASLACGASGGSACLTSQQVEAVRIGYSDAMTSAGDLVFPGFSPGSEGSWTFITEGNNLGLSIASDTYRLAYDDPEWDASTFDIDRDLPVAVEQVGYINAWDTDLSEFRDRGGKLILYHGWSDPLIAPENTINYYSGVLETMGEDQANWLRLFMAPGMGHCRGGEGPDQIDFLGALDAWRDGQTAPASLTAARSRNNATDMTRPLCPYPTIAKWTGSGSTNDASNFRCEAP